MDNVDLDTYKSSISDALLVDYLNELPDDVAVCQPDGDILYVNQAWRKFSQDNGYDGPDFVGQNYLTVCDTSDGVERSHAETVSSGLKDLSDGVSRAFQFVYPCHSPQEKRWFKLMASRTGGQVVVHHQPIVLKHSNITSEVETLPDYRLAQHEAQIAHDVKTSLNGVLGYIQLSKMIMDKNAGCDSCKSASEKLEDAETAGWRITRYLDAMMSRSRLLSKEGDQEGNVANVAEVVENCLYTLKPTAPDIRVNFDIQIPSDVMLLVDADIIHRIIVNVISNAMKYNKQDGCVEIALNQNRSGGIVISIEDSGIGISEEFLPIIFDRFSRDQEGAQLVKGTGLGLASVKELMDALDGMIDVTSEHGKGSRFVLSFPSWRTIRTDKALVIKSQHV